MDTEPWTSEMSLKATTVVLYNSVRFQETVPTGLYITIGLQYFRSSWLTLEVLCVNCVYVKTSLLKLFFAFALAGNLGKPKCLC